MVLNRLPARDEHIVSNHAHFPWLTKGNKLQVYGISGAFRGWLEVIQVEGFSKWRHYSKGRDQWRHYTRGRDQCKAKTMKYVNYITHVYETGSALKHQATGKHFCWTGNWCRHWHRHGNWPGNRCTHNQNSELGPWTEGMMKLEPSAFKNDNNL